MLTVEEFDAALAESYPWIAWRSPLVVRIASGPSGLGCRLCMAREGFKAAEAREKLFQTLAEFAAHMKEKHDTQQHED